MASKRVWVTARWVNKITGWNKEDLRQAREQELITWTKTSEDGIRYDINSIPERLLIKKPVSATNA